MRSLRPEQLILLLVFILVPLFNLLVRWIQRRAREQQRPVQAEPGAAEPAAREKGPPAALPPRVRVIEPALPREASRKEASRQTPPAPQPRPVDRRAAPLGGLPAIRRAIIAMAILGPCRGLEEPPPSRPIVPAQPAPRPR